MSRFLISISTAHLHQASERLTKISHASAKHLAKDQNYRPQRALPESPRRKRCFSALEASEPAIAGDSGRRSRAGWRRLEAGGASVPAAPPPSCLQSCCSPALACGGPRRFRPPLANTASEPHGDSQHSVARWNGC